MRIDLKILFILILFFGIFGLPPHQFAHIKRRVKIILFIIFLIIGVGVNAKSSWAAPINATSCNAADVQTAINAATDGDIFIPLDLFF